MVPKLPPAHAAVLERAAKEWPGTAGREEKKRPSRRNPRKWKSNRLSPVQNVCRYPSIEGLSVREHPPLCGQAVDFVAGRRAEGAVLSAEDSGGTFISREPSLPLLRGDIRWS